LYVGNLITDMFYSGQPIQECIKVAKAFLSVPAEQNAHQVTSVGHCHIDTAWLWPYDETKRKVARSWATQMYCTCSPADMLI
jgi:alpha-mannosidase